MLIISKFHDYYDTVIKTTGVDKSIVFNRSENQVVFDWPRDKSGFISHQFPHESYYTAPTKESNNAFMCFVVGFCGKTYHGVETEQGDGYSIKRSYFFGEDAFTWMEERKKSKGWTDWLMKENLPYWKEFRFPMTMFQEHKTPILLLSAPQRRDWISCSSEQRTHPLRFGKYQSLRINPILRDWGFHTVIDPFTAFQEIQMFISGVLGGSEKETINLSDKNKIVEHGFDPKWSFRKPPKVAKK